MSKNVSLMNDSVTYFKTGSKNYFEVKWDTIPFDFVGSLNWKGIPIHIVIQGRKTNFGSSAVVELTYGEVYYKFGNHMYKGFGGSNGNRPAHLGSPPDLLTVHLSMYSFTIREKGEALE